MVRSSIDKYKGILYVDVESGNGIFNMTMDNSSDIGHGSIHENVHRMASGGHGAAPMEQIAYLHEDPVEARIMLAMALALFSGILQVIFFFIWSC